MRSIFFFLLLAVVVSSCSINKNVMFKTDQDYVFDTPSDSAYTAYRISPNDKLSFNLYNQKGASLLSNSSGGQGAVLSPNTISYEVQQDGRVELPEIGWVKLAGLTIVEARIYLEELYTTYKDSYVRLEIKNRRVIVFPGSGGDAKVITLTNSNTTVIEALALAGGITTRGNASRVKLIRKVDDKAEPEVYLMDLSTIEGIQAANLIVQGEDLLYVEPVPEIAREILQDVAPIISLVSSVAILITIFGRNL